MIKIITNEFISKFDYENLIEKKELDDGNILNLTYDLEKMQQSLDSYGKHFFNCLKYLIKNNRLFIQPVKWGSGNAHAKHMILFDGQNYISTDGSSNFTLSGLTINGEKFSVKFDWENEERKRDILDEYEKFIKIFERKVKGYKYHDPEFIIEIIDKIGENKDKNELLIDSIQLLENDNTHDQIKAIRKQRELEFRSTV